MPPVSWLLVGGGGGWEIRKATIASLLLCGVEKIFLTQLRADFCDATNPAIAGPP